MNREDIIRMAEEAGFVEYELDDGTTNAFDIRYERFAKLVAEHERDELTVMFLEAHKGAKDNHNYWHVAANKIKEKK
jgi:hypothetical protein